MSSEEKPLRQFGKFRLDVSKKVLWHDGAPVDLALKEVELLCVLTDNVGEVVTKEEILNRIWADSFVEESNLSRHVYLLRKTFKDFGESEELIQTVPRRGYRFAGEVREPQPGELVIEKHSLTRTLIEEIPTGDPTTRALTQASPARSKILIIGLICVAIVAGGAAWWKYSRPSSPVSTNKIQSIAILPLKSLNETEADKALSFGFADALITTLGNAGDLKVISANAVSRYADVRKEPLEIGKDLGVDGVLEGTLQRANGKLRVTLRLIRTRDGTQIWSGLFNESEADIFRLQDALAAQTAQALALNLKPKDNAQRPTSNLEAYNLFLKADYLYRLRINGESQFLFFKQAIALDPNFARAWAGLAAHTALGTDIEEAERTLAKALELDPNLAEAHATRGFVQMFHYWDWIEAERSLNRALELDPNSVQAHHWRGVLLSIHGRLDEAKIEMRRALELDPLNLNITTDLGQLYYFAREYGLAEEYCRKALAMDPNFKWAHDYLRDIYLKQGKADESLRHYLATAMMGYSDKDRLKWTQWYEGHFKRGGWAEVYRAEIELTLNRIAGREIPPEFISNNYHLIGSNYLHLGDKDKAIEYMKRSLDAKTKYEQMNFIFPYSKVDPIYDGLRDDPRFQDLLRKINL